MPRPFCGLIKEKFLNLDLFSHVFLTSRTAAQLYLQYRFYASTISEEKKDSAQRSQVSFGHKIYLTIGRATAEILENQGLIVHHIATEHTAEGMVEMMEELDGTSSGYQQAHFFFPRSSQGRAVISDYCHQRNIPLTMLDLYDTRPRAVTLPNLHAFDQIVFTSPSTITAFFQLASSVPSHIEWRCIGPVTQRALARISHKFSEKIDIMAIEIAPQLSKESVQVRRPRLTEEQDWST